MASWRRCVVLYARVKSIEARLSLFCLGSADEAVGRDPRQTIIQQADGLFRGELRLLIGLAESARDEVAIQDLNWPGPQVSTRVRKNVNYFKVNYLVWLMTVLTICMLANPSSLIVLSSARSTRGLRCLFAPTCLISEKCPLMRPRSIPSPWIPPIHPQNRHRRHVDVPLRREDRASRHQRPPHFREGEADRV